MITLVQGSVVERVRQLTLGSGMTITQDTDGLATLDAVPGGAPAWTSITGKPTTIAGYGITDFNSLGDARWLGIGAAAASVAWANITSKPTTISGYGITDFNSLGDARWILLANGAAAHFLANQATWYGATTREAAFKVPIQGSAYWWGHANSDYQNSIGTYQSAGFPYISFHNYQIGSDGFNRLGSSTIPSQIRYNPISGLLEFLYGTAGTADTSFSWTSVFSFSPAGVATASSFSGNGASLTALNATQLTTGSVPLGRLYTTIAGYGITDFNSLGDARWPLQNGTGASGTWLINITGLAGSASAVAWTGITGKPTTIAGYGITDHTFANLVTHPTTISGYGITDFNSLGDARWLGIGAAAASVAWANITSKPTTISGYGITDFNSLGDARWGQLGAANTWTAAQTISAASGILGLSSSTATNSAYTYFQNTGGTYYLGVDNSAGSSFGGSAYSMIAYTPAGLAWWINKATNVQTFTQPPFVSISGATARQMALIVVSAVAPTGGDSAPDGTLWFQT